MIKMLLGLIPQFVFATTLPPSPSPVFLKSGFSTVLEFTDIPTRVVLGDSQSFQVEKVDRSLAIRTLAPYATSNMFVYFKDSAPKLFVLTASEDVEPTYYRKFEPLVPPQTPKSKLAPTNYGRRMRVTAAWFSPKKDYLTIEVDVSADSNGKVLPQWNNVRLRYGTSAIRPNKLWSERQEVQRDSKLKARFIFYKPNLPRTLQGVSLVMPILGSTTPFSVTFRGRSR